jgi:hypothetical protein
LAEKVPGNSQRAARMAPIRRRRSRIKRILIRLNIRSQDNSVYLFRDFLHKSIVHIVLGVLLSWLVKSAKLGRMLPER